VAAVREGEREQGEEEEEKKRKEKKRKGRKEYGNFYKLENIQKNKRYFMKLVKNYFGTKKLYV
jgi:hypothetical protein